VLARMKLMGGQSSSEEFSLWSLFHMYAWAWSRRKSCFEQLAILSCSSYTHTSVLR
jgi:hypothetical protein